jgi:hypothetical protein
MSRNIFAVVFAASLMPELAHAVTFKQISDTFINSVVTSIMGFLILGATAAFFYGITRYIIGARDGDAQKIKDGNQTILWGGVALFMMVSVWGIISYVQGSFGWSSSSSSISIPNVSSLAIGGGGNGGGGGGGGGGGNGGGGGGSNPSGPDPNKSQWDGGSKPCPTGSNFSEQGACVPVKTGTEELNNISNSTIGGASNEDAQGFVDNSVKKMVYAVNNGQLGARLQNTTGSNDEKTAKTMWDMFVKANPPSVLQKITSYQFFPELTRNGSAIYGYVQENTSGNGTWTFAMVEKTHMNNGVLDTAEVYNTVIHEGMHVTTLNQKSGSPPCSTYPAGSSCIASQSYLMAFIGQFYSGSNGAYASKFADTTAARAFVTDYAKTKPSEDIAETYMKFITDDRPTGTSVAEKKIAFFYNYSEFVSSRDSIRSKISLEAGKRNNDADGDGLNDNAEKHRGTNPDDADSDDDGVEDGEDIDADGDGHTDTEEVDTDGDGKEDWEDTDDDGDGIPDAQDTDDDGDGLPDYQPAGDEDGDGTVDSQDTDDDGDGIPDAQDSDNDASDYQSPFDFGDDSGSGNDVFQGDSNDDGYIDLYGNDNNGASDNGNDDDIGG